MENKKEFEVDMLGLFHFWKKKMAILLAVTVLFALVAFVINVFFVAPEYTAATRVYILNRSNEQGLISSDFSISNYVVMDYAVLITGRNVADKVIEKLNLDMTAEALAKKITVNAQNNTRVLQISVSDTDPQRAAEIANCVREEAAVQIKQIMDVDAVNLVYAAQVPTAPSSPNVASSTLGWAAIGFAVILCVLAVVYALDDAIRTEEDVERYLGLSTLGVIPVSSDLNAEVRKAELPNKQVRNGGGLKWKK